MRIRLLVCLVLLLLLASCGRGRPGAAALLEDLDYFLHVMETDFCLFDTAHRARGTDIRAEAEIIRAEILANPSMSANQFFALLDSHFNYTSLGAHFGFVHPWHYLYIVNLPDSWYLSGAGYFFPSSSLERLHYPHVQAFYGSRRSIGELIEYAQVLYMDIARWVAEQIAGETAGETRIRNTSIEEGRIVHLYIGEFRVPAGQSAEEVIEWYFSFFESIRGYDHLIIDISSNTGGNLNYFRLLIMNPNITEVYYSQAFVFFNQGYYNIDNIYRDRPGRAMLNYHKTTEYRRTVEEMVETYYLTDMNPASVGMLEYGFRMIRTITPNLSARFDYQPAFDGKIWLLIGPNSLSAAEYSARLAKNSGFATLVGERTGGNLSGNPIFVALPNTGILFTMDVLYVTDRYGRPFDAGTYPHHFTRPGLTALETVLQLIEEGAYNP